MYNPKKKIRKGDEKPNHSLAYEVPKMKYDSFIFFKAGGFAFVKRSENFEFFSFKLNKGYAVVSGYPVAT